MMSKGLGLVTSQNALANLILNSLPLQVNLLSLFSLAT